METNAAFFNICRQVAPSVELVGEIDARLLGEGKSKLARVEGYADGGEPRSRKLFLPLMRNSHFVPEREKTTLGCLQGLGV